MTLKTLSAPLVKQTFPVGTADTGFTYTVTGTLQDGSPFSLSRPDPSFDLAPGTYTGTVSKLGVTSLPSAPLDLTEVTTVVFEVPDPAQAATFA